MVDIRSNFVEGVAVDTHELGTPICVDLQSPEPAAVATFYATLFGWQFGDTATDGHRTALLRGRSRRHQRNERHREIAPRNAAMFVPRQQLFDNFCHESSCVPRLRAADG